MILIFDIYQVIGTSVGTVVAGLIVFATTKVITAANKVIGHEVQINNLIKSNGELKDEILNSGDRIIEHFLSETDPIKKDLKHLGERVDTHHEKLIIIETKLNNKN